ncbi:unnamed protein product [Periconia digitata]|uniref:Major facilitator superfamily (MFS) profile domain-containing protein n=1 Tax=Periconia digitata TaxID=1303443 RepID=A0A9W4XSF7_9PLEO|nr:unnamed protein product [Periconia digitata]
MAGSLNEQEMESGNGNAPPQKSSSDIQYEEEDRTSLSSSAPSTDSLADSQEIQSLHQTLSRNAGLEGPADKALTAVTTNMTTDPRFEVDFDEDDDENPQNWSMLKKGVTVFIMSISTLVVVMYSTAYTAGIPGMMSTFGISDKTMLVLGVTTYLFGMACGSVILAPLSEMFGRRPVYLVALFLFTILVLPCAMAQNLATILTLRFFGAMAGSSMVSNAPGTVTDISTEEYRALTFSVWSIGPMNGPVFGPLVGGFVFQYLGWRWTNWVVMIGAGASWILIYFIGETYAPALLRAKAAKKRKETGEERWYSRYDDKKAFWALLRENLTRPFAMSVQEPICIFWNIYVALVYGVLYLCFVSYPIVFSQLRGWSPGFTGLGYMGIGIGGMLCICSEPLLRRIINAHAPDPETGKPPPEAAVSIVCISAILVPVGEMIFAWTCTPDVHWIAPIIAGIPFGAGNCGVFIYATNYLVGSYGIYAASALAGNAVLRSVLGGVLPLAGAKMYESLGPNWSGAMLSFLEFGIAPIPFVFYRYGGKIRAKSALIRRMREDRERLEGKRRRAEERGVRENGNENGNNGVVGAISDGERKEVSV